MFVERLEENQVKDIIRKMGCNVSFIKKMELRCDKGEYYWQVFFGNFVSSNHIFEMYDTLLNEDNTLYTKVKDNKLFLRFMYEIFGEEYKEFYLRHVNEMFE